MVKTIINYAAEFLRRYRKHDITGSAAKVTYYLLLSFFPLCLLLISLLENTDILNIFLPESIAVLLQDISAPDLGFQTTSAVVILWSASTSIWALMTGIHTAYTGERKINLIHGRIRAIVLVFILVIALMLCASATFLSNFLIDWILEVFPHYGILILLRTVTLIFFIYLTVVCIYKFIPDLKLKIKSISIGALLTAIGWVAASWGFEVYMRLFNNYSVLYGSIGAFLGLTLWLYTITIVLLSGAEINVMLAERSEQ